MTIPVANRPKLDCDLRDKIEAALRQSLQLGPDCPARLREAMEYSVLGAGKRLRPQLVLLAAEACGGSTDEALPAAVAVELIHAYSLVHDDLPAMDNDDLRRGRPTCHKQFDEATAILVGDALQARAFEILATEIHAAERAARCCAELGQAAGAASLVGGQSDDLEAAKSQANGSTDGALARLEAIHRRKTGALFRASLRLGAITAGATDEQLEALDRYAQALGLAFQVVDDLLDVSGSEDRMGKRLGKDESQGKTTYPRVLGIEASREYAAKLIDDACLALDGFGAAAEPLVELADFVRRRNN